MENVIETDIFDIKLFLFFFRGRGGDVKISHEMFYFASQKHSGMHMGACTSFNTVPIETWELMKFIEDPSTIVITESYKGKVHCLLIRKTTGTIF